MQRKLIPVVVGVVVAMLICLPTTVSFGSPKGIAEAALPGPGWGGGDVSTPEAGATPVATPGAAPGSPAASETPQAATSRVASTPGATEIGSSVVGSTPLAVARSASTTACSETDQSVIATPGASATDATPIVTTEGSTALLAQRALDRINCYRALEGVGPLTLDPILTRAASAHVHYYILNFGNPNLTGMGLHDETSGRPGFTGADSEARAQAAGSTDWYVDENVGLGGSPEATVDWFVNSVNHRENLLHPSTIHLGYASSANPPIDVFDLGVSDARPSVPLPSVYPADRQTDVPTSVDLEESPDPAPGLPRPLGYPITISFAVSDKVTFTASSLTDSIGQPVPVVTAQKQWLRTLALIPTRPLAPGATYTVQVSGTVDDQPFTRTWSFTTASSSVVLLSLKSFSRNRV